MKENINISKAFETFVNLMIDKKSNDELIADYGITDQNMSLSRLKNEPVSSSGFC